jgi:hypothetical protein
MNRLDDPIPLDVDRLLNDLYAMQASFSMTIQQLARTRPQEWNMDVLNSMLILHRVMQKQAPSLTRH